jgi:hypothetical protein
MAEYENKSAAMDDVHPQQSPSAAGSAPHAEEVKRTWYQSLVASVKEPGSATQIIIAAILAIAIGMPVVSTVGEVPQAAIDIIGIPGGLWLRALKCIGRLCRLSHTLIAPNRQRLTLTSATVDRHCYDHCHSEAEGARW